MTAPMSTDLATLEPDPLPRGFRELYATHYDFLWRCALRMGVAPTDVEDAIQETFIVALRRWDPDSFDVTRARPSTWLFAILHNVVRNHARGERRRRARLERLAGGEGSVTSSAGEHVESRLGLRLLDEFLADLDADHRSVFVLAELEGMRGPEIADALGLNANTARSRLRTARLAFRARFEDGRGELIDEATKVRAPAAARARGLAVLALPTRAWFGVTALSVLAGSRGIAAGVLALVVGIGGALVVQAETRERVPSEREPIRAAATPSASSSASEPVSVEASEEAEPIVVESAAPKVQRASRATMIDSDEALDTLARARTALLEGDAKACLALLGDDPWPTALDARRVALEVGALCSLGRVDRARERADEWVTAHPNASTAVELRSLCWDDANTSPPHGQSASSSLNGANEE
jgi:RNA polymerase sigma factor (sigma-70 family)